MLSGKIEATMTLTRRFHFPASHRLHSPHLSNSENTRIYGKCNNPFGHGHNYRLEVTVAGEIDGATGRLLPLAALDRLVEEQILRRFAYRNMNLDVPQFNDLVPTTENLALVIARLLEAHWNAYLGNTAARLHRVQIQETDRNGFELLLPARDHSISEEKESATTYA